MQIMYDTSHWVVTGCSGREVYVANSLGHHLSPIASTQLKQLYANHLGADGLLTVKLEHCVGAT